MTSDPFGPMPVPKPGTALACENGPVNTPQSPVAPHPGTPDDADPAAPAPSAGPTEDRSIRSVRDMVVSLLVILLPVALFFGVYRFFDGGEPVVVDTQPAIADARAVGGFPVSEPSGLDPKWRPTTAKFRTVEGGATLRIGYVTPEKAGVQLVQSSVPADQLLPAELGDTAAPQGTVEVNGRNWQRYTARPRERALVLLEPQRSIVIVGDASDQELSTLAAALD